MATIDPSFPRPGLGKDLAVHFMSFCNVYDQHRVATVSTEAHAIIKLARSRNIVINEVLHVVAGEEHTVICTINGVYTFGLGSKGALGHPGTENEFYPRMIRVMKEWEHGFAHDRETIVRAAAARYHTVFLSSKGRLLSVGGHEFGQLGRPLTEIQLENISEWPWHITHMPQRTVGKIVGLTAGGCYTVVWTAAGEVWSFGNGEYGQLGLGQNGTIKDHNHLNYKPRQIKGALAGKNVVGGAAGQFHTLVWTDRGLCYSFGFNKHGQLGHDDSDYEDVPRMIAGPLLGKKVVAGDGGLGHTCVCTADGEAYSFGNGSYGQLGHTLEEDESYICTPRLIEGPLVGKKVVGVATGTAHTLLYTSAGELFSFGHSDLGALGHGDSENDISAAHPRLIEGPLKGKQVIGVAAGQFHSIVWTSGGVVFTFGHGEFGMLGHGHGSNESVPRPLDLDIPSRIPIITQGDKMRGDYGKENNAGKLSLLRRWLKSGIISRTVYENMFGNIPSAV